MAGFPSLDVGGREGGHVHRGRGPPWGAVPGGTHPPPVLQVLQRVDSPVEGLSLASPAPCWWAHKCLDSAIWKSEFLVAVERFWRFGGKRGAEGGRVGSQLLSLEAYRQPDSRSVHMDHEGGLTPLPGLFMASSLEIGGKTSRKRKVCLFA